jgi:hypothetical protein
VTETSKIVIRGSYNLPNVQEKNLGLHSKAKFRVVLKSNVKILESSSWAKFWVTSRAKILGSHSKELQTILGWIEGQNLMLHSGAMPKFWGRILGYCQQFRDALNHISSHKRRTIKGPVIEDTGFHDLGYKFAAIIFAAIDAGSPRSTVRIFRKPRDPWEVVFSSFKSPSNSRP